jgi:hypothetical protein
MNAQPSIIAKLEADATLDALLTSIPGDTRLTQIYPQPIVRAVYPDAFLDPVADVLRPSIYVSDGGGAVPHPQAWKIKFLVAQYPQVWVYAPTLPGANGPALVHEIVERVRSLLYETAVVDADTGLGGRHGWVGDLGGQYSTEYVSTWMDAVRFQYRSRTEAG